MKFFFVIGILIACLFISDAKPVLEEELVDSSNQSPPISKEEIHESQIPENETQSAPEQKEEKANIVERDINQAYDSTKDSVIEQICSVNMLGDSSLRQVILENIIYKIILKNPDIGLMNEFITELRNENCISFDEAYQILEFFNQYNLKQNTQDSENDWFDEAASDILYVSSLENSQARHLLYSMLDDLNELSETNDDNRYTMLKELVREELEKINRRKLQEEIMNLNEISS